MQLSPTSSCKLQSSCFLIPILSYLSHVAQITFNVQILWVKTNILTAFFFAFFFPHTTCTQITDMKVMGIKVMSPILCPTAEQIRFKVMPKLILESSKGRDDPFQVSLTLQLNYFLNFSILFNFMVTFPLPSRYTSSSTIIIIVILNKKNYLCNPFSLEVEQPQIFPLFWLLNLQSFDTS